MHIHVVHTIIQRRAAFYVKKKYKEIKKNHDRRTITRNMTDAPRTLQMSTNHEITHNSCYTWGTAPHDQHA